MRLAIIPARGGSKRIPRKNIKPFCGKPIIAWSIAAARASGCFNRIVVSTDDDEIAAVARAEGAETPFMRPAALADDHTGTMAVVAHAVQAMETQGPAFDHICCIYPTAPLLQPTTLREAYERLVSAGTAFAFGVASYGHPIQRALRLGSDGIVSMFEPSHATARSQDLEPAYHDAGQFCWGTRDAFLAGVSPLSSGTSVAVVLPRHRVVDIDTPEDWDLAEALHSAFASEGL
ncbi:pseudaminic acid cytidylyltransferase [Variovorax guangxiensis]|uniref:pseudaminic acid cytidylyltransferase n=1 Tax=Variovorax guangxiensis TaxID=1775474 RepID=UPI0028576ED0|nr:pseudaminic acid cytidylyltransferase [Variovorax guangxiensis]MDR6854109.1 N-acylneuraminate cytidylyltransferase [Variovorax guangxiensis]